MQTQSRQLAQGGGADLGVGGVGSQLWTIGPVSLAALAGRTPPLEHMDSMAPDHMPQVEPGNGSYTEGSKVTTLIPCAQRQAFTPAVDTLEGLVRGSRVTGQLGFLL